jgi:hypothetical protein
MLTMIAALLLAILAALPGAGTLVHQLQTPVTPTTAKPAPTVSFRPAVANPGPRQLAVELVGRYEAALNAAKWTTAFDLLAPASLTRDAGLDAFAEERAAFFAGLDGRYDVGGPGRVRDWTAIAPLVVGADHSRAWLVEVDYPALAGNNAGYEQFVVGPDTGGTWRIWPVR